MIVAGICHFCLCV